MKNIEKYKNEIINADYADLSCSIHTSVLHLDCIANCRECKKSVVKWLLEEYSEPILDEAEKEYLSAVIKPFRKKVKHIAIWDTCNGSKQFVHIKLYDEDCINLPNFKPNAMYKGMELHKEYTLEELGL